MQDPTCLGDTRIDLQGVGDINLLFAASIRLYGRLLGTVAVKVALAGRVDGSPGDLLQRRKREIKEKRAHSHYSRGRVLAAGI